MQWRSLFEMDGSARNGSDMARPFFLVLYLVLGGGYVAALAADPSLREPGRLALLTALVLTHGGLYWISERYAGLRRWWLGYFLVQAALVFAIGLMLPGHWLIMALTMALAGQAAGALWPELRLIALVVLLCFALLTANLIRAWGLQATLQFLPVLALILTFVLVYVGLFGRQAQARERAQALLRDLEAAHSQLQAYADRVEELTISRERERIARELHDTLAQGLAGLILQLEAADSHLEQGDPARAQEVVQQTMRRARTTLAEARRAIQALRPAALEDTSLIEALGREVDQFAEGTGVRAVLDVAAGSPDVSPEMAQDILRIVQESLSNVARHADASNVLVRLAEREQGIRVVVRDDGVGFDPAQARELPGCFGLAGMRERAERLGGALRVESERGQGTTVELDIGGDT
jgi:NarL family two-component system sensor histidine kinase YdfH